MINTLFENEKQIILNLSEYSQHITIEQPVNEYTLKTELVKPAIRIGVKNFKYGNTTPATLENLYNLLKAASINKKYRIKGKFIDRTIDIISSNMVLTTFGKINFVKSQKDYKDDFLKFSFNVDCEQYNISYGENVERKYYINEALKNAT